MPNYEFCPGFFPDFYSRLIPQTKIRGTKGSSKIGLNRCYWKASIRKRQLEHWARIFSLLIKNGSVKKKTIIFKAGILRNAIKQQNMINSLLLLNLVIPCSYLSTYIPTACRPLSSVGSVNGWLWQFTILVGVYVVCARSYELGVHWRTEISPIILIECSVSLHSNSYCNLHEEDDLQYELLCTDKDWFQRGDKEVIALNHGRQC